LTSLAAQASPVCIDGFRHVPDILDALKAELNRELRPGRFVITGSTRHDALPLAAQAPTGRPHVLTPWPFSQGEIDGVREEFVGRLMADPAAAIAAAASAPVSETPREEYATRLVRGGFPLAVPRSEASRARRFDDHIRLCLERDVRDLRRLRQRARPPGLLEALAGQAAQVLNMAAAARRAGLDERTGEEYARLLEAVFLIHRVPAWGTTLRARGGARPEVHLVDSGVAAVCCV
jgi:predicted AAA+ superfamily ATPase